jgi:hypothetical protein
MIIFPGIPTMAALMEILRLQPKLPDNTTLIV